MIIEPVTVLGHAVERRRNAVDLRVVTDQGAVLLRFTFAQATEIGSTLRIAATHQVSDRKPDANAPIPKPSGQLL